MQLWQTHPTTTGHHFAGVNGMVNRPFFRRREDGQPSSLTKNYFTNRLLGSDGCNSISAPQLEELRMTDYKDDSIWLMKGDCLERMKEIESGSVDMVLTACYY